MTLFLFIIAAIAIYYFFIYKDNKKYRLFVNNQKSCPNCHNEIQVDFNVCPVCKETLKKKCAKCGEIVHSQWKYCPFCEELINTGEKNEKKQ